MKVVLFECDWCGVRKVPRDGDEGWPVGWSNLDEHRNDDLLCAECLAHGRKAVASALDSAKVERGRSQLPGEGQGG